MTLVPSEETAKLPLSPPYNPSSPWPEFPAAALGNASLMFGVPSKPMSKPESRDGLQTAPKLSRAGDPNVVDAALAELYSDFEPGYPLEED